MRLLFHTEPELKRIIAEAKQLHKVMCLYLFHSHGERTSFNYRGHFGCLGTRQSKGRGLGHRYP
ncbi:hypothetical protein [Microbulbifer sp. VVAC002]|uniref:hypothetical protein n=1 Tax=Microbulbifer sp. VVAC002 TaxID=3243387 RepID=UPI00403A4C95